MCDAVVVVRVGRLRVDSGRSSSRLTLMSVTARDAGVYACRHQLDTDQLVILVLTTADQPRHNGQYSTSLLCDLTSK